MKSKEYIVRQKVKEYKNHLKKMTNEQLKNEWDRVALRLNPDSTMKDRLVYGNLDVPDIDVGNISEN